MKHGSDLVGGRVPRNRFVTTGVSLRTLNLTRSEGFAIIDTPATAIVAL